MLDLFNPPRLPQRVPDIVHLIDHGKMTAEQKKRLDAKAANNLKQYLRRKK